MSQPTERTPIAELRRCPTCQRWGGLRRLAADGHGVELDPAHPRGPCIEGPWHGSLRGPRNACGQWLQWRAIGAATRVQDDDPNQDALPRHSSSSSSEA